MGRKKDLLSFTRSAYAYILKMLYNHYLSDLVHIRKKKRGENEYKESGIDVVKR